MARNASHGIVKAVPLPVPLRRRLVSWPNSLLEKHYRINEGGPRSAFSSGLETKETGSGDLQNPLTLTLSSMGGGEERRTEKG